MERRPGRKRKEYRWHSYGSDGKLHRIWLDTADYQEAEALVNEVLEHEARERERQEAPGLEELLERFVKEKAPYVKDGTVYDYRLLIPRFIRYVHGLGVETLLDLQEADLRGYAAYLTGQYSPPTVNKHLRVTKTFLNYFDCHKQNKQLRPVPAPEQEIRIVSPEELVALLKAADEEYKVTILTLALSGMSLSEMLTLTWDQIDFERDVIRVTRRIKRRRVRFLPIHKALHAVLEEVPRATNTPLVFPSRRTAGVRNSSAYGRAFRKFAERAGLGRVNPHDLRKSFVSAIVGSGQPAEVAQELAGHSDPQVTRGYYLQLRAEALRKAVASLPDPTKG